MVPPVPEALSPERARARLGAGTWLDVRDDDAFAAAHLPGSGSVPLARWAERRHECPPHGRAIVVIADDPAAASEAARRLAEAGHARVAWLDAAWGELGVAGIAGPGERLWRPAPFLEATLPRLPRGRALDVACGTGRDAVALALAGFDVEAWDHDAAALERARDLALRNGARVQTVDADLEAAEPPAFGEAMFDLIVCFRYLHRPLFAPMARALAPGGHLVYETYRVGQERFGPPRRLRFLLRPGELREAFAAFEILDYAEPSPPGGPLTARLLARRPGG